MIVVDTGAMLAILDRSDRYHAPLRRLFEHEPGAWVVPSAIIPEVDYFVANQFGSSAQDAWIDELAAGVFRIEWGTSSDLERACALHRQYRSLAIGYVDGTVIAVAERLNADAIATLDLRHFAAVKIRGAPRLLPRDLDVSGTA